MPVDVPVRVPFEDGRPPEAMTFTDTTFELQRTMKLMPEIWVNHDRSLRIGRTHALYPWRDWWHCDFAFDEDTPDDIAFDVGQPVSVGLTQLKKTGGRGTFLREVSLVRDGAIKGAQITRRTELKLPTPAPPAALARKTTSAPAPSGLHRNAKDTRETEELHRRMDWLDRNGYPYRLEDVLENLKAETGHGDALARHYANYRAGAR